MRLAGEALNDVIEKELREMVREGYSLSPITNKSLFDRLKKKGIISGSISTLTSRKEIIETYKKMQLHEVGGTFGKSARSGATQSRLELIKTNAKLREQVDEARKQVADNTESLINIIQQIKMTGIQKNIERVISPYLIRELHKRGKN
ncbi:hypothetical protein [Shewanella nanhaiensis]|uniref:DNA-binding protein n=1 Tax=Shewanella nanhaiensis TaxID=2864872 RepID=A0ABS7E780_9GAMM|nr:hypothetical protein [Shewanella nanhaiensis]MBW8185510.1 hypothetical protein [Shewanella nanhaiensis]